MATHDELEKRLRDIEDLVRDNGEYIRKVNNRLAWSQALKIFYWLLILGVAVVSYYAAQPYLNQFQQTYSEIEGRISTINGLFGSKSTTTESSQSE